MILTLQIEQSDEYFSSPLTLPVVLDDAASFAGALAPLNNLRSLTFSLDDVIRASTQYLKVYTRKDELHDAIVLGWLENMRWHIATFWHVRHAANYIAPRGVSDKNFAMDYTKYSGEMLAQGVALRVLEECNIGAEFMLFVPSGQIATPDFAYTPDSPINGEMAAIDWDGTPIGLEARCRSAATELDDDDRAELAKKKNYFRQTASVYFRYSDVGSYGLKRDANILVADPINEDVGRFDEIAVLLVVARHYENVAMMIGIYEEVDILKSMITTLLESRIPPVQSGIEYPPRQAVKRALGRQYGERWYHGRLFNSTLSVLKQLSKRDIQERIRAGDVGPTYFIGLAREVLQAIHRRDVRALRSFKGPNVRSEQYSAGIDGMIIATDLDTENRSHVKRRLRQELKSVRFRAAD